MDIFPIDWHVHDTAARDEGGGGEECEIHCWGRSLQGASCLARIRFFPYFFARCKPGWSEAQRRFFVSTCCQKYGAVQSLTRIVERVPLLGFTNCTKAAFVQLAFGSLREFKRAKYAVAKNEGLKTYEASLDPLLRFFHVRAIDPSGWIRLEKAVAVADEARVSIDGVTECTLDFRNVHPSEVAATPALVMASWDLECISSTGMFPDASAPGDKIITIGTAFQRYGEAAPYHRCVVTLGSCDLIEGTEVRACEAEHEVINAWLGVLRDHGADVLLGYNTTGFDYPYLNGRACVLTDEYGELLVDLGLLGKSLAGGGMPMDKKLSSGAYGDNTYHYLTSPGVMSLDLLQIFRKDLKLDSYSLNNVAKKYLGEEKIDLKPSEIFSKFALSSADRCDIATYCIRDVELPLKLSDKLATLTNALAMSNAACVPVEYLMNRGQQIKVYSLLTRKARATGFVAPDMERGPDGPTEKFQGATVLEAKAGGYFDVISGLDFASLYPSIIRAHNMCPSTIVRSAQYDNMEGVEYYRVETAGGTITFAQGVPCVVPALLEELAGFRKDAKKRMAAAKERGDDFNASVFNGLQNAYKVSMNSVYGFFGATKGILPLVDLAAAVTSTGRSMIAHTKQLAETLMPGSEVVYGDSVARYTPILVRTGAADMRITTFEALDLHWIGAPGGKQSAATPPGTEIWSDAGWTPLFRVIRHLAGKGMVRVATPTGVVDVTTDHSLLCSDGTPITPAEVSVGTALRHADLPVCEDAAGGTTLSAIEARIMGFFLGGAGHCSVDPQPCWMVCHASRELMGLYRIRCEVVYRPLQWTSLQQVLAPLRPSRELCERYASLETVMGSELLAARAHVRQEFWEGWCDAGGSTASQLVAAHMCYFAASVGVRAGVDVMDGTYRVFADPVPSDRVTSADPIAYEGFVYDATTANHHFAAGIGRLVVHNTDSVMVRLNVGEKLRYHLPEHFSKAQWLADTISETFKAPIQLEFEKLYYPYLLFSKKRYAGLMFTRPEGPDYIDVKGLQLVRRDNAPIVKEASTAILDAIMYDKSKEGAVVAARTVIGRVLRGEVPMELFVISKAAKHASAYKNPGSLPHVCVAEKIKQRRGYAVASGERVRYVFIKDPANADALMSRRAEDPDYVEEHALELDALHYIQNQLLSPITTLLEVLKVDVNKEVMCHPDIAPRIQELSSSNVKDVKTAKRIKTNIANNQREISHFFSGRMSE